MTTMDSDLGRWLTKWNLQQYEQKLRKQGIQVPNDFKYIKSKTHFEKLVSKLGDDITLMESLKLEDAWASIVPNPQQPKPVIHFLGDEEKAILSKLNERYNDLSEDINIVQKVFNDFNQSVVENKKKVNDNANKMILSINTKKEELLQKINSIHDINSKKFNDKLDKLSKLHKVCKTDKAKFEEIVSNSNIDASQKSIQLKQLLSMNIDQNKNINDDEKQNVNINYDNYKIIGNQCVISGKIDLLFNEQTFNNALSSSISINCKDNTSKWKLKQNYNIKLNQQKMEKEIYEQKLAELKIEQERIYKQKLEQVKREQEQIYKQELDKQLKHINAKNDTGFIFNVFESGYMKITDNGTLVTGIKNCSYSVVTTTTGFNTGMHQWKIQFLKNNCCHSNPGVLTTINGLSAVDRSWTGLKNSQGSKPCGYLYMWHDNDQKLQGYHSGVLNINQGNPGHINVNDIITVILNCSNWTITFLRNNQHVGVMNVPHNQTYYPCLYTCACKTQQYKLITSNKSNNQIVKPAVVQTTRFLFNINEAIYTSITQNGTMITGLSGSGGCYYTMVTTGTTYNSGVHQWKIKYLKKGHHYTNPGVITNVSNLSAFGRSHRNLSQSGAVCCGYLYMWNDYDQKLQGYQDGKLSGSEINASRINVNDIVTVILNCNNWTITFLRNNQRIGSMHVAVNQNYHPSFLTCDCDSQQYQLIA